MRRADRLFQIIQILRGAASPVTANVLAGELETSVRTIYRDVADLMAQRVPIRGEAGVGYVIERSYDMPPLMLTPDEIEAAVLGAQLAAARGDPAIVRGARDLIAKIADVVPDDLRPMVLDSPMVAPDLQRSVPDAIDVGQLRAWIRRRGKIRIDYSDDQDRQTERIVWPIAIAYFETVRLMVGWCELRQDFRSFRTDRITRTQFLEETYPTRTRQLRRQWWAQEQAQLNAKTDSGQT